MTVSAWRGNSRLLPIFSIMPSRAKTPPSVISVPVAGCDAAASIVHNSLAFFKSSVDEAMNRPAYPFGVFHSMSDMTENFASG
jgi:hypothetical protein